MPYSLNIVGGKRGVGTKDMIMSAIYDVYMNIDLELPVSKLFAFIL